MHPQRRPLRHVDLPYARVQVSEMHITITYIKCISTAPAADFLHKSDMRCDQNDGGVAPPHSGARYIILSTDYLSSGKGNACADKLHSLAFDYSDRCVAMRVHKD
jgi:hypothetical protein